MPGFLLVNKPVGPTSHDIVDRVRRMTGAKTVGHAGTLDPFASGLLIVGVGREATREFSKLVGLDKRYRAVLHLGATSDTDDRTGRITTHEQWTMNNEQILRPELVKNCSSFIVHRSLPTENEIQTAINKFSGKILQTPPMYSAKKIHGKKMYELAREGKTFERTAVPIEIYSIVEAKPRQDAMLVLDIHCSSGTYVRALARDIGEALPAQGGSASGGGCGAYLEELNRTAVGPFTLEEAVKADELNKDNWEKYLLSPVSVIARSESLDTARDERRGDPADEIA